MFVLQNQLQHNEEKLLKTTAIILTRGTMLQEQLQHNKKLLKTTAVILTHGPTWRTSWRLQPSSSKPPDWPAQTQTRNGYSHSEHKRLVYVYTAGHPGCGKKWKEQIINNKKPPPSWYHQLEQTPEVVMSRACPQWMFHCHATSLTSDNVWLTNSKLGEDGVGISDGCVLCRCNLTDQFWTWWR